MSETNIRVGSYFLQGPISAGGMGEVWLGCALGEGGFFVPLVFKRILTDMTDDGTMQRLLDEGRITALLNHENICRTIGHASTDDSLFMVMEFIDGVGLNEICWTVQRGNEPVPSSWAAYVVAEICAALAFTHGRCDFSGRSLRIIHRDVSPNNVMVTFTGAVKLIDFGIAKMRGQLHETRKGVRLGKQGYMSPEQYLGQPLDHRTDIYNAGLLLYELLTGVMYLQEEDDELMNQMVGSREQGMPTPLEVRPDLPAELDTICLCALSHDPNRRYQHAGEMLQRLAAFYDVGTKSQICQWMARAFDKKRKETVQQLARLQAAADPLVCPVRTSDDETTENLQLGVDNEGRPGWQPTRRLK